MSFRDNQDLRDTGKGGWGYAEHELWSVFAPLIGPLGVSVYMAFARLVKLAAIDADRQITARRLAEYSCVSKSKCAEVVQTLCRLGMVHETQYLDGRTSTYQLPSLRTLAGEGQAELLRRIGVRPGDTAPYDQEAKHKRERKTRLEKSRLQAESDAFVRPHPLWDAAETEEPRSNGVRTADTTGTGGGGVEEEGSVSAKTVAVSTESVAVSAKSVAVSTGGTPIKREEEREEDKNPLPPAGQGEEGDGDDAEGYPTLPYPGCVAGDGERFEGSLEMASQWAMGQLGITKRRLGPVIEKQLRLWCRQHRGETLETGAALLVANSRALHRDKGLLTLTNPWGWARWFEEGHWLRPLPYDQAKLDEAARARVGQNVPQSDAEQAAEAAARRAQVVAYLEEQAGAIGSKAGVPASAERLRLLARDFAAEELGEADAEKQLLAIEHDLVHELQASAPADELEKIEAAATGQISGHLARLSPAHVLDVKRQLYARELLRARGLPRLGLFYVERA